GPHLAMGPAARLVPCSSGEPLVLSVWVLAGPGVHLSAASVEALKQRPRIHPAQFWQLPEFVRGRVLPAPAAAPAPPAPGAPDAHAVAPAAAAPAEEPVVHKEEDAGADGRLRAAADEHTNYLHTTVDMLRLLHAGTHCPSARRVLPVALTPAVVALL